MTPKPKLFWDSCVFIAHLNNEADKYDVESIGQYLEEAEQGELSIYTSSIALAEITPGALKDSRYGSFTDFLRDFRGNIEVIDPNPPILILAGLLKDLRYCKNRERGRRLTMGDAVMLATILELEDTYGVKVDALHTFDQGKSKGAEGRAIPLLDFEEWCEGIESEPLAQRIISMKRCKPVHPTPRLRVVAE